VVERQIEIGEKYLIYLNCYNKRTELLVEKTGNIKLLQPQIISEMNGQIFDKEMVIA